MSQTTLRSWRDIHHEVLRRIRAREWKPGDQIPNEADLAAQFGCARATVNRALQVLAEDGILDRKRKAGTRVALHPVSRAVIEIPIIRREIEDAERDYGYRLLSCAEKPPAPRSVGDALGLTRGDRALHVAAMHLADGEPYVLEDRWINLAAAPSARRADFSAKSPNEWLLENVPYTKGALAISAVACGDAEARRLGLAPGAPVLLLERTTWGVERSVTTVRLWYPPGHQLTSPLPT